MQILTCPKCQQNMVKIYTIGDKSKAIVDFSLENANETTICRNCGKKISYSVRKTLKGEQNGGNPEN